MAFLRTCKPGAEHFSNRHKLEQLHIQKSRGILQANTYQSLFMLPARAITFLVRVFYKPVLEKYLSRERVYRHGNILLNISPEVFHPGFFHSTKLLLKYVSRFNLQGKSMLELGAGSGLISIKSAKNGAIVTSSDINPTAIAFLRKNAPANQAELTIIESDLFEHIPKQPFDFIIVNPPYYFKQPVDFKEQAWYCGENGEYFSRLFEQAGNYTSENTVFLMTLCEGCDIKRIQDIAAEKRWQFKCVYSNRTLVEKNYIYQLFYSKPTDTDIQ